MYAPTCFAPPSTAFLALCVKTTNPSSRNLIQLYFSNSNAVENVAATRFRFLLTSQRYDKHVKYKNTSKIQYNVFVFQQNIWCYRTISRFLYFMKLGSAQTLPALCWFQWKILYWFNIVHSDVRHNLSGEHLTRKPLFSTCDTSSPLPPLQPGHEPVRDYFLNAFLFGICLYVVLFWSWSKRFTGLFLCHLWATQPPGAVWGAQGHFNIRNVARLGSNYQPSG